MSVPKSVPSLHPSTVSQFCTQLPGLVHYISELVHVNLSVKPQACSQREQRLGVQGFSRRSSMRMSLDQTVQRIHLFRWWRTARTYF